MSLNYLIESCAAKTATVTISETVASSLAICAGRLSPTSNGPITVPPPNFCNNLDEIADANKFGIIKTFAGPLSLLNG